MKNKKIKVMADLINGIFTVSSFEDYDQECEVLSQQDFIESLRDGVYSRLVTGELIGTELDRNKFREIKDEYGIQQNFSGWSDIVALLEAPITGVSDSFIIFKFIIEREEKRERREIERENRERRN